MSVIFLFNPEKVRAKGLGSTFSAKIISLRFAFEPRDRLELSKIGLIFSVSPLLGRGLPCIAANAGSGTHICFSCLRGPGEVVPPLHSFSGVPHSSGCFSPGTRDFIAM